MADTWKDWLWDGARRRLQRDPGAPVPGRADRRDAAGVALRALHRPGRGLLARLRAGAVGGRGQGAAHADTAMLSNHAADTADVELALHETLVPALGIDPARVAAVEVSPTTRAYASFLLATPTAAPSPRAWPRSCPVTGSTSGSAPRWSRRAHPNRATRPGSTPTAATSSRPPSTRCSSSPTASGPTCPRPRRGARASTSTPPPATSGCSGTRRGARRRGRSDAGGPGPPDRSRPPTSTPQPPSTTPRSGARASPGSTSSSTRRRTSRSSRRSAGDRPTARPCCGWCAARSRRPGCTCGCGPLAPASRGVPRRRAGRGRYRALARPRRWAVYRRGDFNAIVRDPARQPDRGRVRGVAVRARSRASA